MGFSLYDATVANYRQTLGALAGVLEKGDASGVDPATLAGARLCGDMHPLSFQVWSVRHHSLGAVEGCKAGLFGAPAAGWADLDYAALRRVITQTDEALARWTPADVSALEGRKVIFQLGDYKLPFTAEGFLMSFSLPNFYFHAVTTYDILRAQGVKIGKRDFMGPMRMKAA
jgi:hypothetical protein